MAGQFKLEGTVGPSNDVEPRDARKLKQALMQLGDLDSADVASLDFIDSPTLEGLKAFQKRSGLVADGIAKPGGPTEGVIAVALEEQGKGTSRQVESKVEDVQNRVVKPVLLAQAQKPAGAAAQQPGGATISWPVKKQNVTDGFQPVPRSKPSDPRRHTGIDFRARLGAAIVSTHDGTVHTIGKDPARSGSFILIQNDDGSMSGYAHTGAVPKLRQGQRVRSGQQIGVSDGTPKGIPAHLHYTYRPGTKAKPATPGTPKADPFKTVFKGMKLTP